MSHLVQVSRTPRGAFEWCQATSCHTRKLRVVSGKPASKAGGPGAQVNGPDTGCKVDSNPRHHEKRRFEAAHGLDFNSEGPYR